MIVSKRGMSFQAGKIKEVCWNDGICYQGFLSYKKIVLSTGQEHKEEYRHTYSRGIAGLVPDHHNIASIGTPQKYCEFGFQTLEGLDFHFIKKKKCNTCEVQWSKVQ